MTRAATAALLAVLMATLPASWSVAAPVQLSDEELGNERGGIETPFGFAIGFGASVRTFVNGDLALETTLTWTPTGPRTTSMSNTDLGQVAAGAGAMAQMLIPGGVSGATQVLHDIDGSHIVSLVLNSANGRTIRQDTDITLSIPQLASLQQSLSAERLALTMTGAVGMSLATRSGH